MKVAGNERMSFHFKVSYGRTGKKCNDKTEARMLERNENIFYYI